MYKKDQKKTKLLGTNVKLKRIYYNTHQVQDKSLNWCGMNNMQLCCKSNRTELHGNIIQFT